MIFSGQFWVDLWSHWREILTAVKTGFIIADVVIFLGIVACWRLAWKYRVHFTYNPYAAKRKKLASNKLFARRWKQVTRRFTEGTLESFRVAVIEADTLADQALKAMQLKGEQMAERLQQLSSDDLRSLDGLWKAHRTRNDLVHTPGFQLSPEDARATLKQYEDFFKEIGMLVEEVKKEKKKDEAPKPGVHKKGAPPLDIHGKKGESEERFDPKQW